MSFFQSCIAVVLLVALLLAAGIFRGIFYIIHLLQQLRKELLSMNPTLQSILADEAQMLTNEQTIGAGVNTLIANTSANTTLIASLNAQIAAGTTEPADLQQIATALAANDAANEPILAALASALPPSTPPATPAAPAQ